MDGAEALQRRVHDALGRVVVGQVDDDPGRVYLRGGERRLELGEPRLVEVGGEHRGARSAEPRGEPASDPAGGSGHDRDPALEGEERRGRERPDRLRVEDGSAHGDTSTRT